MIWVDDSCDHKKVRRARPLTCRVSSSLPHSMVASTTRVVPLPLGQIGAEGIPRQSEPEGIALSSLNPDTDGDGTIEEWEKDVYNRIVAADTDCTGTISRANLFDFIRGMSNEVKEAASKGIPISSLNPDTDGDGKVEKWEMDVFSRIKSADEDKSGSISVKELFGVIKGAAESDKQKKLFARLLVVAVLIIFALIGAMLAMGIVAGEAVKESHVTGQLMTTTAGDAVQVEPSRSYLSLFELPQASTASLAKMESLTMYIDMTTAAAISGWVEATYKVSGCYKKSDERLYLSTPEGHVITIDASQSRGTIAMADGANYDITDQTPPERRHMAVAKEPTFMSEREAREEHHRKLRELGFFTALMTSGNVRESDLNACPSPATSPAQRSEPWSVRPQMAP